MTETAVAIVGWLGFACCTLAYLLLNLGALRSASVSYQLLNALGGAGLVISAVYFQDIPNLAANGMWVLIAGYGLIRYLRASARRVRRRDGFGEVE